MAGEPEAEIHPAGPPEAVLVAPPRPGTVAGEVPLLPGPHSAARQAGFLLVNGFTLVSLGLGLLAILLAMRGEPRTAALCLLVCVVVDGLDGALARRFRVSSPFGGQMDSLADMCAFGMAAPVVLYTTLVDGPAPAATAALVCALFAACAAVRLARFNVCPKDGRYFTGVPTTLAAAVLAGAVLLAPPVHPVALLVGVVVLAVAMVSRFPYPSLRQLVSVPPWLWLVPVAGGVADLDLTFLALVAGYLTAGPMLWLFRRSWSPGRGKIA